MNTYMTGFSWFSKELCILVLLTKVDLALEGLNVVNTLFFGLHILHANVYYLSLISVPFISVP